MIKKIFLLFFTFYLFSFNLFGSDSDSTVMLFPSQKNPGISSVISNDFFHKMKKFLSDFKHYLVAEINPSEQDESCIKNPECLPGLGQTYKTDKLIYFKLSRVGTNIILSFNLYNLNKSGSERSKKPVIKNVKENRLTSTSLFQEIIEELFEPEDLFEIRGFLKVQTNISQGELFLDGKNYYLKSFSGILPLLPGSYRAELRKEGFVTEKKLIEIKGGLLSSINFQLLKVTDKQVIEFKKAEPLPEEKFLPAPDDKAEKTVQQDTSHSSWLSPFLWSLTTGLVTGSLTAYYFMYYKKEPDNKNYTFYNP